MEWHIVLHRDIFCSPHCISISVINFADESLKDTDIAKLVEASQAATFGRGGEDVFDESYRKAWKMDCSQFAPQFDVIHSGVMDIVHEQLLHYEKGGVKLDPRLYKLNVYGMISIVFTIIS